MSFKDWIRLHSGKFDMSNTSVPEVIKDIKMDPVEFKEDTLDSKHAPDYYNYYPIMIDKTDVLYINIKDGENCHKISQLKKKEDVAYMDVMPLETLKIEFPEYYFKIIRNTN